VPQCGSQQKSEREIFGCQAEIMRRVYLSDLASLMTL